MLLINVVTVLAHSVAWICLEEELRTWRFKLFFSLLGAMDAALPFVFAVLPSLQVLSAVGGVRSVSVCTGVELTIVAFAFF